MHETHKIPRVDLPGVDEEDFVCYPRRGDSLSLFSKLYDRKLGLGRGYFEIRPDEAAALMAERLGIAAEREDDRRATVPDRARRAAEKIFPLPGRARGPLHALFSVFFDWNDPPMFKSFLRVGVADGALRIRCHAATGCLEHEQDPPVEDEVVAERAGDGTWRPGAGVGFRLGSPCDGWTQGSFLSGCVHPGQGCAAAPRSPHTAACRACRRAPCSRHDARVHRGQEPARQQAVQGNRGATAGREGPLRALPAAVRPLLGGRRRGPLPRGIPSAPLAALPGPAAALPAMRVGQVAALGRTIEATRVIGPGFFGVPQARALLGRGEPEAEPEAQGPAPENGGELSTRSVFGVTRHPNNWLPTLLSLLEPRMTNKRAMFCALVTTHGLLGSLHEEYRLRAQYATAYERYCEAVPFLVSLSLRTRALPSEAGGGGEKTDRPR